MLPLVLKNSDWSVTVDEMADVHSHYSQFPYVPKFCTSLPNLNQPATQLNQRFISYSKRNNEATNRWWAVADQPTSSGPDVRTTTAKTHRNAYTIERRARKKWAWQAFLSRLPFLASTRLPRSFSSFWLAQAAEFRWPCRYWHWHPAMLLLLWWCDFRSCSSGFCSCQWICALVWYARSTYNEITGDRKGTIHSSRVHSLSEGRHRDGEWWKEGA